VGHEDPFPRPGPNGRCRFGEETFAGVRGNGREPAIRGANLFECLAVAEKRWVDKCERCQLHRTRGWRDLDLSTNLLEQGGIIEKDRLAPQRIALEVLVHDRAHSHWLSSSRPPSNIPR
jgi:hypothetical protein